MKNFYCKTHGVHVGIGEEREVRTVPALSKGGGSITPEEVTLAGSWRSCSLMTGNTRLRGRNSPNKRELPRTGKVNFCEIEER